MPRFPRGVFSARATSSRSAPTSRSPVRATRTRRISFVPSKIMFTRESRRARSYGYSSMKPLPPAICSESLITFQTVSVPKTLQAALHATQRRQFGTRIADFELTRAKFARMVVNTYALESIVYLTAGLVDRGLADYSL